MLKTILLASSILLAVASPGVTASLSASAVLDHNGSVMTAEVDRDMIRIVYTAPRPGLAEAGVKAGAVLFRGSYRDGEIRGLAFAFKSGCPFGASYDVVGKIDNGTLTLDGTEGGPSFPKGAGNCRATIDPNSKHRHLAFTGAAVDLAALDVYRVRDEEKAREKIAEAERQEAERQAKAQAQADEEEAERLFGIETSPPVASTVVRNDTPPPAPQAATLTEQQEIDAGLADGMEPDQIEEALIDRRLMTDPAFREQIAAEIEAAEVQAIPAAQVDKTPKPAPAKSKLQLDF